MNNFRVEERGGLRWYIKNNIYHPSVSTVNNWQRTLSMPKSRRKAGNAANLGTAIHFQIEKTLYDNYGIGDIDKMYMPDLTFWNQQTKYGMNRINMSMRMFYRFIRDYPSFEPLLNEFVLFSEDSYPYAGRIDLVAKIENEVYLIDFKTGAYYPEYDAQICGGYAELMAINGLHIDKTALLFLDSREDRNPSLTYQFKVYSEVERAVGSCIFQEKLDDYYQSGVYQRILNGE
jgi:hypothetical protein